MRGEKWCCFFVLLVNDSKSVLGFVVVIITLLFVLKATKNAKLSKLLLLLCVLIRVKRERGLFLCCFLPTVTQKNRQKKKRENKQNKKNKKNKKIEHQQQQQKKKKKKKETKISRHVATTKRKKVSRITQKTLITIFFVSSQKNYISLLLSQIHSQLVNYSLQKKKKKKRGRERESFVAVLVAVGHTIVSRSLSERERERKSFLGERFSSSFFSTFWIIERNNAKISRSVTFFFCAFFFIK